MLTWLWFIVCVGIPVLDFSLSIWKDRKYEKAFLIERNSRLNAQEKVEQMARSHQKQIDVKTWKQRNGVLIELSKMEDSHLANTIKMVARNCHKESYLGEMISDRSFIKLADECRRRKFQVSILNIPITVDGRREYIEVFIPHTFPLMKISASILPSDWDSRPQE